MFYVAISNFSVLLEPQAGIFILNGAPQIMEPVPSGDVAGNNKPFLPSSLMEKGWAFYSWLCRDQSSPLPPSAKRGETIWRKGWSSPARHSEEEALESDQDVVYFPKSDHNGLFSFKEKYHNHFLPEVKSLHLKRYIFNLPRNVLF